MSQRIDLAGALPVDNFTHSLTGWALGQAGLKTRSRKGLAALIMSANLPDIDVLFGWVSWAPLAMHRGFTHGLVGGVLVLPPFLAALLWLFDRWQVQRGTIFDSGLQMRFGWLLTLCYIGAITHPLLDLQNTYAVQLLSPLSDDWFHNDALFIVDVWLWLALAIGIAVSRRRERAGQAWSVPAQAALAAMVAYVSLNAALSAAAKHQLAAGGFSLRADAVFAAQQPFLFWTREMVWRAGGRIGRARFDLVNGIHAVEPAVPDNMALPIAVRARADAAAREFLRWSVLPIATISETACRATVSFGDARFGSPRVSARFLATVDLPLDRGGCR